MNYKRKSTRPMRAIETSAITTERDELRERVDNLRTANMALRQALTLKELEAEQLFTQKVALANQLRTATFKIAFLEGRETNQGFEKLGPGSHYGFKRWLLGWNE